MKFFSSSPYVSAALLALALGEMTSSAYARLRSSHTTMDESVAITDGPPEIPIDFEHRALTGISKHADMKVNKVKLQILQVASLAKAANESLTGVSECTFNTDCAVGFCEDGKCRVHPMVAAYMETVQPENGASIGEGGHLPYDIFVGVSRDDGQTWKRINVSKNAKQKTTKIIDGTCKGDHGDDESHGGGGGPGNEGDRDTSDGDGEGDTGDGYPGDNYKPMIVAKGKQFLVAWTSKYCKGGVGSTNSSETVEIDKYQVKGHQGCHDYTGEGAPDDKVPFGMLVPFSCVWSARGVVEADGTITVTRGERHTSGRRDAFQLVAAVAGNLKGWALAWQEDPLGLKTGEAAGPGEGMSGATVNHKTDIWYSYLDNSNFKKWTSQEGQGDSGNKTEDHGDSDKDEYPDDTVGPLPQINDDARFSGPVRVTANAPCRVEVNESVYENDHPKITRYYGGLYCKDEDNCHTIVRQDNTNSPFNTSLWFCKTKEGVILNGNSGASRPNIFLIPTSTGTQLIMGYEESKGLGFGDSDDHGGEDRVLSDAGETGEHDQNDTDAGKNVTEKEDLGKNVVFQHAGDFKNVNPISKGDILNLPEVDFNGVPKVSSKDNVTLLRNNARRIRFIQQPPSKWGKSQTSIVALWREGAGGHGQNAHIMMRRAEGGYNFKSFHCQNSRKHPITKEDVCVSGVTNVSGLSETNNESNNTDSRAHRGFMRGDFLVIAFAYAEQWGRVGGLGNRYDLYQITSHDGGKKFTDKAGQKRGPRNLSNLKQQGHNGWSITEPRIYATPGSIDGGQYTTDDLQNPMVYYIGFGTTSNPHQGGRRALGEQPSSSNEPQDLYYSVSFNYGETFYCEDNGNYTCVYPSIRKVKGNDATASYSGLQMRTNPAGNKLYAVYVANDGPGGGTGGGGPCQGGKGYDVCFNSTKKLGPFDGLTEDGLPLPDDFNKVCEEKPDHLICDLDGDGYYTGADMKLYYEMLGEWEIHNPGNDGNDRNLRRNKKFM